MQRRQDQTQHVGKPYRYLAVHGLRVFSLAGLQALLSGAHDDEAVVPVHVTAEDGKLNWLPSTASHFGTTVWVLELAGSFVKCEFNPMLLCS